MVYFNFFQISINVTDLNDRRPVFESNTYTAIIDENLPDGFEIGLDISATDSDISDAFNTESIRYELISVCLITY